MPTIAYVSSKGGVGKTTASLLTALGLAGADEEGPRIAVIDADPNLPLVRWAGLPGRPERIRVLPAPTDAELTTALRVARFDLGRDGKPQGRPAEWIVIDTEGGARKALHTAIRFADLVLTPCGPSMLEAVEAIKVIGMAREAEVTFKRPIPHACVLTRVPPALRPRSVVSVVQTLAGAGVPIVAAPLIDTEPFRALFSDGGALDPASVEAAPARANLDMFAAEIRRLVKATSPSP